MPEARMRLIAETLRPAVILYAERFAETARAIARERQMPLFEILEHAEDFPELHRAGLKMREFAALIRDLQASRDDIAALFDLVLEKTGYLKMLENAKEERDQNRADNVRELKSSILQYIRESGDAGEPVALGGRPDGLAFIELAGRLAEKLG